MTTPADDQTLLQAWARDASEEAFAVIARKYAGLIYHAALRRTGRAQLAEEAAQNTLAILARKAARVARHPGPAAWLHRTACYEAAKLLRRERRHEDRMKNLLQQNDAPHDPSDLWSKAAPVLDAALNALPEGDRRVLMLKYFDGWTFERMSERLGGQAAAWRQRGSRAVERLRRVLARKGLTLSAAVIAGGLGASLSLTAPPAFAATLTTAPLRIAAGLTWKSLLLHTLQTMNLKHTAVTAGAVLAALVPLGLQYSAVAGSRDRVAALETEVRSLREAVASPGKSAAGPASSITGSAKKPGAASADKIDLAAWAAVLEEARSGGLTQMTALMAIEKTLDGVEPDAVEALIMTAVSMELPGKKRVALIEQLLSHYSGADPDGRRSVELIARLCRLNGSELTSTLCQESNNGASMLKWAKKDPPGARAWLEARLKEDVFAGKSLERDNFLARDLTGQLFTGLYAADRAGAMQFLSTLDDEGKGYALEKLSGELRSDSGREELLKLLTVIEQPENRRQALNSAAWDVSHGNLKAAGEFINRAALPPRENRELMVEAARISDEGDIRSRMAWLRGVVAPEEQSKAVGSFLGISASEDELAARKALDAELAAGPNDELLSAFIGARVRIRPGSMEEGLRMALRLTDAVIRERTVQEAVKSRAAGEVRAAGQRVGMPAEEIERALAAKKP